MLGDGVCAAFRTGSLAKGAQLVQAISRLEGLGDHDGDHDGDRPAAHDRGRVNGRPDIDLRFDTATVRLVTIMPGFFGLTERDLDLARRISAIARDLGLSCDPAGVQNIHVCIDALAFPDVLPFWRAILGYRERGDLPVDLSDPARLDAVTHLYDVRIQIGDPADLTHLQLAWAVAAGLVRAGCHTILDAHAITWLDGDSVAALPADRPFALGHEISILAETDLTAGFGHAVHTRGMHKFARPDLITGVPAEEIEYTGRVLNHLAGRLAEGAVLVPGQVLRLGDDHTMELSAYRPDGNVPEVHLNNHGLLIKRLR